MPDDSLLVPVLIPHGSLHFSTVSRTGTVQNVIDSLVKLPEVVQEVLGDLACDAWALQLIRTEEHGRTWEEHDLKALGDGT
jgi:diaphanous 1